MKKTSFLIPLILCIGIQTIQAQKACFTTLTDTNTVIFITDDLPNHTYNWNFGDGEIETNNPNPIHTYSTGNQLYDVRLIIDSSGVSDTLTKKVIVLESISNNDTTNTNTSISEIPTSIINIYPNPATDKVFIETTKSIQIQLLNLQGKILFEKYIKSNEYIDVSYLNNGIYFLKSEGISIQKLIIQH